ncbi:MAG: lipid-A-disaccharide synthase [Alphaproteobacteria bacterium]|nr:MAG: lipid-A-disaccharide synthase [Alphaproteobacteria bacterium]
MNSVPGTGETGGGDAPHICLLAGEHSGDHIGAGLMAALTARTGGKVRFSGIGGGEMTAAGAGHGFESFFPMEELSIGGIFEIVPHIPRVLRRINETVRRVRALGPDMVVTIDSPAFAFRVGKKLKGTGPALVHTVAPTVWAWRPRRARMISGFLDHLLMIFPFEAPYFTKWGLNATFIGHPAAEMGFDRGDGPGFRRRHGIGAAQPLLCLLPGSRHSEVNHLLPVFGEVLRILEAEIPDLAVVVPTVATVSDEVREAVARWPLRVTVTEGIEDKRGAFAASDAALAASGTVTYELAMAGVPMVIAYRLDAMSSVVIKAMVKIAYASVINIVLGRQVVPEFIQGKCEAKGIAGALMTLFRDPEARRAQVRDLAEVARALGLGQAPSSQRAAEIILGVIAKRGTAARSAP